jgi:cyclopropane fatty-acyl-phospholipid synthase-like methyltransferase
MSQREFAIQPCLALAGRGASPGNPPANQLRAARHRASWSIAVNISDELRFRLEKPAFPRSSAYSAEWLFDTMMGPNVLWLAEWASRAISLRPGMRVLDLGCGKAASSIFLAKEFGVTVWAVDLWIKPSDNLQRIEAAGLADRVMPIYAEAHTLPFAEDYFDAIVSFDAYHYFGTDDLYLGYVSKFIGPGGRLCIVVPGLTRELPDGPPESLRPYWECEFCSFHSPGWWRRHWSKTGLLEIELADSLADGWQLWAEWNECCAEAGAGLDGGSVAAREAQMLRTDQGQTLAFTRIIARRPRGVSQ